MDGRAGRIPDSAREVLNSGTLAHLVTLDADGGPHVTCVWVKAEGDEIVSTSMTRNKRYVHNLERDPRVVLSIPTDRFNEHGLQEYLVVKGRVRITEGGGAAKLRELAELYLGPETTFQPPDLPGLVLHTTPEEFGGVGPWAGA
jgi:PPOX class probable F420-dependent enzyme